MKTEIRDELLAPRLPALGYIKIGGLKPKTTSAKGNDFQPPQKFDHFEIRTRNRGEDGNFERDHAVHQVIGDKPTELAVRLAFDQRAQNFYAQMTHYKGRTRAVECDGVEQTDCSNHVTRACARRAGQSCLCKPYGRLAVILEAAPTFGGLYVFRTTSWESVNSIQTALRMFESQFGALSGLPLSMRLYPAEVQFKGTDGQMKTGTAYKVALVLRASFEEARAATLDYHRSNQIARREILALASGTATELDQLDVEDAAEIGPEFFPGTNGTTPSRLAEINAKVLQGAPVEGEQPLKRGEVRELERLMDAAAAAGRITPEEVEGFELAIHEKNARVIRDGIEQLSRAIAA